METEFWSVSAPGWSEEKLSLQQLNGRLDSYLQQVWLLEAANQMLESQIHEELDRRELRHLRTVSLLQEQISERLSAQAEVKLQLLGAKLSAFNLKFRYEREHEQRGRVEAELRNLRLMEEELKFRKLPELQNLLNVQSGELVELQIRRRQDVQGLRSHVSGAVAVAVKSSDLIRHSDHLRETRATQMNRNRSWFQTQVCSEVMSEPPTGSQVSQEELEELGRTAANQKQELKLLQNLVLVLEVFGRQQDDAVAVQMEVQQQTAEGLRRELDWMLQAADRADQVLLEIRNQLQAEKLNYRSLLVRLNQHGASSLHFNFKPTASSSSVKTRPGAFRANIAAGDQTVSSGHICSVRQKPTPVLPSEKITSIQSVRVQIKLPENLARFNTNVTSNSCKSTAAEAETGLPAHLDPAGGSAHIKNKIPPQITTSLLEAVRNVPSVKVTGCRSTTAQKDVSDKVNQVVVMETEVRHEEGDQSSASSDSAPNKLKDVEFDVVDNDYSGDYVTSLETSKDGDEEEADYCTIESVNPTESVDPEQRYSASYCDSEELRIPREVAVSTSPAAPTVPSFSPELRQSPVEAEVLSRAFHLVDLEDCGRSPDLSLSPNDSERSLSPIEIRVYLSPNGDEEEEEDEDEEICLSPIEANSYARPVERYILSTREEGKEKSFEEDIGCRSTSPGVRLQVSASPGGLEWKNPAGRSTKTETEEQFGFRCLYQKILGDAGSPRDGSRDSSGLSDNNTKEKARMFRGATGKRDDDWLFVGKMDGNGEKGFGSFNRNTFTSINHKQEGVLATSADEAQREGEEMRGRFRHGSGERTGYGGGLGRTGTILRNSSSEGNLSLASLRAANLPETGRFGRNGIGEWMIYGGSLRRRTSLDVGDSLPNNQSEERPPAATKLATSPPRTGRFSWGGSGEWTGRLNRAWSSDRVAAGDPITSPPNSHTSNRRRLCSPGGGGNLRSGQVVRRSSSLEGGGGVGSSGWGVCGSPGTRGFANTGSCESKPVYSSGDARKSSVRGAGWPGRGSTPRTPSPGGMMGINVGGGGRRSRPVAGSSDRMSSRSSSGSGRSNGGGQRVMSSGDRPIKKTGSSDGGSGERMSVCKKAALSIAAAGRQRSQERPTQRSEQQASAASPLLQRWLTTGVTAMSADHDDITHL